MTYHVYPQDPGSPSARSDTDLWNHINRWIWGKSGAESSPRGNWGAGESTAIVPTLEHYGREHQEFHGKFQDLGDALKAHADSPHNQGGGNGFLGGLGSGLASTGVIILVAVGGYLYLTRRKGKK